MLLLEVPGHGPEDVSCTADGSMITGLEDGRIVHMTLDGRSETLAILEDVRRASGNA